MNGVKSLEALEARWRAFADELAATHTTTAQGFLMGVRKCADELATWRQEQTPAESMWLARILAYYAGESCDTCPDCGALSMCDFHSLLSLLQRGTFLDKAHQETFRRPQQEGKIGWLI